MIPVTISPAAKADLMDIADYIAVSRPQTALEFTNKLEARCRAIGNLPKGYRMRPELGDDIRSVVSSSYLIFYRALEKEVRIERILHGSRNLPDVDFG